MACNPNGAEERRKNQFYKISFLSDMALDIAAFGENQGIRDLVEQLDLNCGAIPPGDFEHVIDPAAPHQFLDFYTKIAEHRFAFAVTQLLKLNPLYMTPLNNYCLDKGKALKGPVTGVKEAFDFIQSIILDGMPCDETYKIITSNESELVWEKLVDTHEGFWNKVQGNVDVYYELQSSFIKGLLEDSNISFTNEGNKIFRLNLK